MFIKNDFQKFWKYFLIFFGQKFRNIILHHVILSRDEFRTTAMIFRLFEFQLQPIFTHIGSFLVQNQLLYSFWSQCTLFAPRIWCVGARVVASPCQFRAKTSGERCIHPARSCRGRRGHREKLRGSVTQLTAPNEGIFTAVRHNHGLEWSFSAKHEHWGEKCRPDFFLKKSI